MTEHYITLFNYNYLPQGLTMFFSLKKNYKDFVLWIVCMDKRVENFFLKKKFKEIRIIPVRNLENKSLIKVKKKRKFVEYCWTLTPFLPYYVFNKNKSLRKITYVDADIFFYKSPSKIIKEFKDSKKSIFLTEHGFHPKNDLSKISGRFCVQYMIFKNNIYSKKILRWWQNKCLEWCHDYPDNGRLGDQKYLDQWPKLFKDKIYISKNKKYFQAPWTFDRFKSKDIIIYHFHGLKIRSNYINVHNHYGFTKEIIDEIYIPYCKALKATLKNINFDFFQDINPPSLSNSVKTWIKTNLFKKRNLNQVIFNLSKINEKNKK